MADDEQILKTLQQILTFTTIQVEFLESINQHLEDLAGGGKSVGRAPQDSGGGGPSAVAGGKSIQSEEEKKRAKQAEEFKKTRLAIGTETMVGLSNPTQSKVITLAESAKRVGSLVAGQIGERAGGESGRKFAEAAFDTALNLSGVNQQISNLKSAQSALVGRVVAASDAGLVYSDEQLKEIAASEIGRMNQRGDQLKRAASAFDKALLDKGIQSVQTGSNEERNKLLQKIEQNTKSTFASEKSQRGNSGG